MLALNEREAGRAVDFEGRCPIAGIASEVLDQIAGSLPVDCGSYLLAAAGRPPLLETAPFLYTHAGLLPNYRGRHVISWAIINEETELGLTVHFMDDWIDRGDIILQRRLPIAWTDTYETMNAKVQTQVPDLAMEAVRLLAAGGAPRRTQRAFEGTYFTARTPADTRIDWKMSSREIYNLIRAGAPPLLRARTAIDVRELQIIAARYDLEWPRYRAAAGAVVGLESSGVRVKTGDSLILIERVCFTDTAHDEFVPRFPIGTRLL